VQGIKTEWQNLPKRKCDNCGATYRPKRPLLPGERGFHADNCRKEYHKHGGSYGKLKPYIEREIKKRIKELSPADASRMEAFEVRLFKIESALQAIANALSEICK
jgi:hypothetical protein